MIEDPVDSARRPTPGGPDAWWALAILDGEGRLTHVNQALCDLLETTEKGLVGQPFLEVVTSDVDDLDLAIAPGDGIDTHLTSRARRSMRLADGRSWEGEIAVTRSRSTAGEPEVHVHLFSGDRRAQASTTAAGAADLASAIDQMRVGVAIVGIDGRATSVNRALCDISGYPESVLVGEIDLRLLTHPEDRDEDLRLAVRLATGDLDSYVVDKRLIRPDGAIVWVRQEVTLVRDDGGIRHLIAQIIDITDQKRTEHQLDEIRTRYVELVERMPIGILSSDEEGRIVTANGAAAAIAGLPEIPPGFHVDEIIHPDDLTAVWKTIAERTEARLDFHVEFRIVRPDGTLRWVRNDAHPQIDAEGRFLGLTGTWLDVSEVRAAEDLLRQQAIEDQLTGLGNRRFLFDNLDVEIAVARAGGPRPSVLFVDLDGFKAINDAGGHGVGDLVLVEVAERLRSTLGPTDTAARIGGDEFVVCCSIGEEGSDRAERLAADLIDAIGEPFTIDGVRYELGTSVGVADWRPGVAADDLVNLADRAVYRAKRDGRGCWRRA